MSESIASLDGQLIDGLEFCAKVYAIFEAVRSKSGGIESLRLRSDREVKLLQEELLSICRYIQTYYRIGRYICVRWIDGNQSYDAELHQRGWYIDHGYFPPLAHLEATCAMHANEHWTWELANQGKFVSSPEGINATRGRPLQSEPVVFTNNQHVENFAPIIIRRIKDKAKIPYPENTSLVIQCNLNTLYMPDDWRLLVSLVESKIANAPFNEILLIDQLTQCTAQLRYPVYPRDSK